MVAKQPFVLVFSASLILSCSSGGDPVGGAVEAASGSIERVVNEVVVSSGVPVTIADLVIEGMSCEMMCGGSIKKTLAKIDGVESTEILFNEGDEADHAVVTYNEAQVTDAQLVAAIQALYDGQYQVKGISITRQVKGTANTGSGDVEAAQESKVNVYAPAAILLPSVLTILSRILGE
jgi:copper chaperone CopZ